MLYALSIRLLINYLQICPYKSETIPSLNVACLSGEVPLFVHFCTTSCTAAVLPFRAYEILPWTSSSADFHVEDPPAAEIYISAVWTPKAANKASCTIHICAAEHHKSIPQGQTLSVPRRVRKNI